MLCDSIWPELREEIFNKHKMSDSLKITCTILKNILENPSDPKFLKLKS
jgi:hypothetical protein